MTATYSAEQITRFWSKVERGGDDECWPWRGNRTNGGYGTFRRDRRRNCKGTTAHRVAWEIQNGRSIPSHAVACHSCDNPPCCNPSHIFIGTRAENQADMVKKGRQRKGANHPWALKPWLIRRGFTRDPNTLQRGVDSQFYKNRLHWTGTSHYLAKFTEDDIRAIRKARENGEALRAIAERFGTNESAISQIARRKRYANVV